MVCGSWISNGIWTFGEHGVRLDPEGFIVGAVMGGLKLEISDEIRLFQFKTLKEVISLPG